jgi:phosphoribosyl 1,2-cyclic phosphodiesterase
MRMTVLASGSRGNSTVVATRTTRLLVDAGLSCREILRRMQAAGEDPRALDAILITHEHQDHVQGVAVLARRLGIPVYFTEMTHRAWERWMRPRRRMTYAQWIERRAARRATEAGAVDSGTDSGTNSGLTEGIPGDGPAAGEVPGLSEPDEGADLCEERAAGEERDPAELPAVAYFEAGRRFVVGDIGVEPFTIPHDAADPVGFVFEGEGARIGFATDLGYMPPNARLALRGCDVLLLESNHDTEMLRDGPYPWSVKQRVMSRVGHLSNDAAANFLEKTYDGNAAYVVLAHLSESNNLPELARVAAERALRDRMNLLGNRLVLAEQRQPLGPISF